MFSSLFILDSVRNRYYRREQDTLGDLFCPKSFVILVVCLLCRQTKKYLCTESFAFLEERINVTHIKSCDQHWNYTQSKRKGTLIATIRMRFISFSFVCFCYSLFYCISGYLKQCHNIIDKQKMPVKKHIMK